MTVRSVYPLDILDCETMNWRVAGGSVEGLRPLSSDTPDRYDVGRGGLWRGTYGGVYLETREEMAAWRATRAKLRSGARVIVVPVLRREWFAQPLFSGPIEAELLQPAVHGATELFVRVVGAEDLIGAEPFTIVHPVAEDRLYEMSAIEETGRDANGVSYRIEINPPLREACAAGVPLDFNEPRCLMRLADANGMDVNEEIVSFADVDFIEDLRVLAGAID